MRSFGKMHSENIAWNTGPRTVREFDNPPQIHEWCGLIDRVVHGGIKRLCVIALRDYAKNEVFAVDTINIPG